MLLYHSSVAFMRQMVFFKTLEFRKFCMLGKSNKILWIYKLNASFYDAFHSAIIKIDAMKTHWNELETGNNFF